MIDLQVEPAHEPIAMSVMRVTYLEPCLASSKCQALMRPRSNRGRLRRRIGLVLFPAAAVLAGFGDYLRGILRLGDHRLSIGISRHPVVGRFPDAHLRRES